MIGEVLTWLNDPAHWRDTGLNAGILTQLLTHIRYCAIALVLAALIAVPLGLWIGHTGRGRWLVSSANALRAIPTVGLLILLVVMVAPHFTGSSDFGYLLPTLVVLVILAIPPLLAGTYSGIDNVDPSVRDAAYGMGMSSRSVLWRVELPNALPLMFSGLRSAALQVIATATVAAYVTLGGLGRFIYDGLAQQDYPQMIGGGILVAGLALVTDLGLALIQRFVVSPGVTGRFHRWGLSSRQPSTDPSKLSLELQ